MFLCLGVTHCKAILFLVVSSVCIYIIYTIFIIISICTQRSFPEDGIMSSQQTYVYDIYIYTHMSFGCVAAQWTIMQRAGES